MDQPGIGNLRVHDIQGLQSGGACEVFQPGIADRGVVESERVKVL